MSEVAGSCGQAEVARQRLEGPDLMKRVGASSWEGESFSIWPVFTELQDGGLGLTWAA